MRIRVKYSGFESVLMAYNVNSVSMSMRWEMLLEMASGRYFVSSLTQKRKTSHLRVSGAEALLVTTIVGTLFSRKISAIRKISLLRPVWEMTSAQSCGVNVPDSISCMW